MIFFITLAKLMYIHNIWAFTYSTKKIRYGTYFMVDLINKANPVS